jgi:hypothetical protein
MGRYEGMNFSLHVLDGTLSRRQISALAGYIAREQ